MHIPLETSGQNYDRNKGADYGAFAKDAGDETGFLKSQVLSSTNVPVKTHYAVGVARDGTGF